jgi:WD40 repeat protein
MRIVAKGLSRVLRTPKSLFGKEGIATSWFGRTSVPGEEIFSSSKDKTIRVWALDTGVRRSIIASYTAPINVVSPSPDGRQIMSASDDARLRIWELTDED